MFNRKIGTVLIIFVTAFFTGCEDTGQISNRDDQSRHTVLKPPLPEDPNTNLPDHVEPFEYRGTIIETTDVMLRISDENEVRHSFQISPKTVIKLNDAMVSFADLKPGQTVEVVALVQEDLITATEIIVTDEAPENQDESGTVKSDESEAVDPADQSPAEVIVEGTIESAADPFVVADETGKEHEFEITDQTKITLDGEEATTSNLQTGQFVVVKADVQLKAIRVDARNNR